MWVYVNQEKKGVQLKHEGNDRGMDIWGTSNEKGNIFTHSKLAAGWQALNIHSAWKSMRAEILFMRMENQRYLKPPIRYTCVHIISIHNVLC